MPEAAATIHPAAFTLAIRVYYEDTDAAGVVYHANYLRFMERARTEWLRSMGYDPQWLQQQERLLFAVRTAKLRYLAPARYNSLLRVSARLLKLRRASLLIGQDIDDAEAGRMLCSGEVDLVAVDAVSLRPRGLPDFLRDTIMQTGMPA